MSTGTHYIGSKISLISKAEIRYEGVLYQVDTKEATVTLAKVRSFGTEGRPAPKPIPPRNETYEFIIFRGSDIKDLHVSEMPKTSTDEDTAPQDPAILSAQSVVPSTSAVSSQTPPTTSSQTGPLPPPSSSTVAPSSHPPQPIPPIGGVGGSSNGGTGAPTYAAFPPPSMGGYTPFGMPYIRPPPHMMPGLGGAPPPHAFGPLPPAAPGAPPPHAGPPGGTIGPSPPGAVGPHPSQAPGGGSGQPQGSSLPQPLLPHPPVPTSVPPSSSQTQTQQQQLPFFTPPPPQIITSPKAAAIPIAPATISATPSAVAPASSEAKPQASSTPLVVGTTQNSVAETTPKASLPLDSESPSATPSNVIAQPPIQVDQSPPNQTSAGVVAPGSLENPAPPHRSAKPSSSSEGHSHSQQYAGDVEGQRNANGREKRRHGGSQQNRRGYQGRGGRDYRGPPRGGRQQGPRRDGRGGGGGGGGSGSFGTYRYDSEFDFESANARFNKEGFEEEFKHKLNIDDHSSTHSRRTSEGNEGAESPTSDDVIVEDMAGGIDGSDEGGAEGDYYDKSKSFFDNISCESNTPGANHRPSRNEEREVNTETFGVGSVRGYGYRGYRRGRGRGGRGRGYYRGGGGGRRYYGGRGGGWGGRGGGGGYYQQKGRGGSGNRRGGRGQDSSQYYRRTQDQ